MRRMAGQMAGWLVAAGTALAAGKTDLSEITAVYVPTNAPRAEREAALNLAKYLGRASGTNIPVNPASRPYDPGAERAVFIGAQLAADSGLLGAGDLEALTWDGFALRFDQGRVAVAGNKPTSANNGVVELLQRIGFLFSEWNREFLAAPPTLVFRDGLLARNPAFEFRSGGWFWFHRGTPELRGNPRAALDPELFTNSTVDATHTSGYLVPKKLYREAHPEYFSMDLSGKRELYSESDAYVHLCLSNPDVQRIAIERVLGWVRLQPERVYFSVTQGDGHDWCQCEECLAHDVVQGNYSDRMLKLLVNPVARAVARERPDAKIVMLAYCGTDEPPVRERPEKNVYIMYCPYWGVALSMAHPLTHPLNAESLRQFRGWRRAAPGHMMIYDYNIGFVPSWDAWAQKVKWFHAQGVRTGAVMCGLPSCFRWMFAHINEQLQWDPRRDPEALKRRYVETVYGPAAPHLMAYFDIVRERLDQGYALGIHGGSWTGFFGAGAMPRMVAAFDRALEAVAGDEPRTNAIQGEFDQVQDTYLFHAVSAEILAGERTAEVSDDLDRKAGNLSWTITDQDRACARALAARRLDQFLKTLAWLEEHSTSEASRKVYAPQAAQQTNRMRRLMERMGPMTIPGDADVPALARLYIADPAAAVARHPRRKAEPVAPRPLPDGVLIPAGAFRDGWGPEMYSWYCRPGRVAAIVYAARAPRPSVMRTSFSLARPPDKGATLDIEGQDSHNDFAAPALIRISINGQAVFEGPCGFVKRGWSRRAFDVPPGVLKAGANALEVRNVCGDTQRLDGWWFALSEAKVLFK